MLATCLNLFIQIFLFSSFSAFKKCLTPDITMSEILIINQSIFNEKEHLPILNNYVLISMMCI